MIELLGFAPDVDPTTPGVLTDCSQLIPSEKGMVAAPSAADGGTDVLVADCRGAAVMQNTSGTRRTIAGTQSKLYALSGTAWSDVSTGTYTGSTENRWSFAQFGDAAIASNDVVALQASTAGTFATIAGAPIARMIVSAPNFVLAFDTNDATYGDQSDRWRCSAYQDHSSWTVNVTTQATTGRLIGSGGGFTAAARFGQQVVAYKAADMFVGSYVGPPTVWQWDQVPGDVGCVGPEAVCDIGGAHFIVGDDDIRLFDGTRPTPVAAALRQWFYNDSSATYRYRTITKYDRQNGRVWVFYCSTSNTTGTPDSALVWHKTTGRWGRANRVVEAALNYLTPGQTWDSWGATYASWDALPAVPWDSQAWQSAGRALAIFDSTHDLKTLTGAGENSGLTTGDYGDDFLTTDVMGVRLRFLSAPTTGTVAGQTRTGAGEAFSMGGSGTLSDAKFDLRQSGRFHRFAFLLTGSHEVSGFALQGVKAGRR
jgi:hypothetical protein